MGSILESFSSKLYNLIRSSIDPTEDLNIAMLLEQRSFHLRIFTFAATKSVRTPLIHIRSEGNTAIQVSSDLKGSRQSFKLSNFTSSGH